MLELLAQYEIIKLFILIGGYQTQTSITIQEYNRSVNLRTNYIGALIVSDSTI